MTYIYKVYKCCWYKNPITNKWLTMINYSPRVNRDDVVQIVKFLKLKTVVRIKQNKKPYISVMLISLDEYRKLVSNLPSMHKETQKRNLARYK